MTRGAPPKFADDPYAQWMRQCLEERGWEKQDLAAAILEAHRADGGTRLGESGAEALVRRATHGKGITPANRALITRVLGEPPRSDRPLALEAEVERLTAALAALRAGQERMRARVVALERALALRPPKSGQAELGTGPAPMRRGTA